MVEQDERERAAFPILEASIDHAFAWLNGTIDDRQQHETYTAVPIAERLLVICSNDKDAVMQVLRAWLDRYAELERDRRASVASSMCHAISVLFGADPSQPNWIDQDLADEGVARGWRTSGLPGPRLASPLDVPRPPPDADEDTDIREHLAALGPAALGELERILEQRESTYRTSVLRALSARPTYADLATLIAMADTDEVVRLRLLRAIRDLGV